MLDDFTSWLEKQSSIRLTAVAASLITVIGAVASLGLGSGKINGFVNRYAKPTVTVESAVVEQTESEVKRTNNEPVSWQPPSSYAEYLPETWPAPIDSSTVVLRLRNKGSKPATVQSISFVVDDSHTLPFSGAIEQEHDKGRLWRQLVPDLPHVGEIIDFEGSTFETETIPSNASLEVVVRFERRSGRLEPGWVLQGRFRVSVDDDKDAYAESDTVIVCLYPWERLPPVIE